MEHSDIVKQRIFDAMSSVNGLTAGLNVLVENRRVRADGTVIRQISEARLALGKLECELGRYVYEPIIGS